MPFSFSFFWLFASFCFHWALFFNKSIWVNLYNFFFFLFSTFPLPLKHKLWKLKSFLSFHFFYHFSIFYPSTFPPFQLNNVKFTTNIIQNLPFQLNIAHLELSFSSNVLHAYSVKPFHLQWVVNLIQIHLGWTYGNDLIYIWKALGSYLHRAKHAFRFNISTKWHGFLRVIRAIISSTWFRLYDPQLYWALWPTTLLGYAIRPMVFFRA